MSQPSDEVVELGVDGRGRSLTILSAPSSQYDRGLGLPPSSVFRPSIKSSGSSQSRPTSPAKKLSDLAMAEPPIEFFEADAVNPPEKVRQLYEKLQEASEGYELLPESLKVGPLFICSYHHADN